MIELKFTGMCEGCKHVSIELHKEVIMTGSGEEIEVIFHPHCQHEAVCEMWEDRVDEAGRKAKWPFEA